MTKFSDGQVPVQPDWATLLDVLRRNAPGAVFDPSFDSRAECVADVVLRLWKHSLRHPEDAALLACYGRTAQRRWAFDQHRRRSREVVVDDAGENRADEGDRLDPSRADEDLVRELLERGGRFLDPGRAFCCPLCANGPAACPDQRLLRGVAASWLHLVIAELLFGDSALDGSGERRVRVAGISSGDLDTAVGDSASAAGKAYIRRRAVCFAHACYQLSRPPGTAGGAQLVVDAACRQRRSRRTWSAADDEAMMAWAADHGVLWPAQRRPR